MDIVVSSIKLLCAKFKQNCVFELKLRMCALSTPSCNNCSMLNKSQKIWLEKKKSSTCWNLWKTNLQPFTMLEHGIYDYEILQLLFKLNHVFLCGIFGLFKQF
jgi:hypothetical protein